jgi:peptidoglycan/xylan/chitin deacetylase (PgdA/CDA1 family)
VQDSPPLARTRTSARFRWPTRVLRSRRASLFLRPFIGVLGVPAAAVVERVLRLTGRRVGIALVYHGLAVVQGDPAREIVAPHGISTFERQIRYLRRRYRIVEATDLLEATKARRRHERFPVAVTFDDDLPSHVSLALPVLVRTGTPATFFLSGASLERPFGFWWERLQRAFDSGVSDLPALVGASGSRATLNELRYSIETMPPAERDSVSARLGERLGPDPPTAGLRAGDVEQLVRTGLTVGFHTLRHDSLTALSDDALAHALRDGRDRIEDIVGHRLDLIAYPHGRADDRVATAARRVGFTIGFTVDEAPTRADSNPLLLGRITPSYRSRGHFALQLLMQLLPSRRA